MFISVGGVMQTSSWRSCSGVTSGIWRICFWPLKYCCRATSHFSSHMVSMYMPRAGLSTSFRRQSLIVDFRLQRTTLRGSYHLLLPSTGCCLHIRSSACASFQWSTVPNGTQSRYLQGHQVAHRCVRRHRRRRRLLRLHAAAPWEAGAAASPSSALRSAGAAPWTAPRAPT